MGADAPRPDGCTPVAGPLRPVAFYLPQFHPVAQNDAWFGPGFTEWTRVVTARPRWRGHAQPHLPGELGYYDLRVPEVRAAQAALAAAYGVHGFCYWHYWFGGGATILERPLREVVATGEPDLPFCIGWANHDWSGAAAGMPDRLLVRQEYPGPDDQRAHFAWVRPVLEDPRYLRVDGAAVVYVLRPTEAAAAGFVDVWRDEAARAGLGPLYLVGQSRPECPDPRALGFDLGCVLPLTYALPARPVHRRRRGPRVDDYAGYMTEVQRVWATDYPGQALGVVTNWDNTPRSGADGLVLEHATPAALQRVLHDAFTAVDHTTNPHGLVFLKSWNEWAEGNHLEPDRVDGRARLEALAAEVRGHAPGAVAGA